MAIPRSFDSVVVITKRKKQESRSSSSPFKSISLFCTSQESRYPRDPFKDVLDWLKYAHWAPCKLTIRSGHVASLDAGVGKQVREVRSDNDPVIKCRSLPAQPSVPLENYISEPQTVAEELLAGVDPANSERSRRIQKQLEEFSTAMAGEQSGEGQA